MRCHRLGFAASCTGFFGAAAFCAVRTRVMFRCAVRVTILGGGVKVFFSAGSVPVLVRETEGTEARTAWMDLLPVSLAAGAADGNCAFGGAGSLSVFAAAGAEETAGRPASGAFSTIRPVFRSNLAKPAFAEKGSFPKLRAGACGASVP